MEQDLVVNVTAYVNTLQLMASLIEHCDKYGFAGENVNDILAIIKILKYRTLVLIRMDSLRFPLKGIMYLWVTFYSYDKRMKKINPYDSFLD